MSGDILGSAESACLENLTLNQILFLSKSHDMRVLLSCHLVIYFLWAMEETIAMPKSEHAPQSCDFIRTC